MPIYQFTAYARDGQKTQGREFAQNAAELERKLRSRKLILVESNEARVKSVRRQILAKLIAQLSPLLASGIVIDRALQIIADDGADKNLSDFAAQLREGVKRGEQLSQVLESAGAADRLAIAVIRAGEASGQLAEVLQTLEKYYDSVRKIKNDIQSALIYPATLVVLSLLSIVVLGVYVVPTFKNLFSDRMDFLPWNTRLIFAASDFLLVWGWLLLASLVVGGFLFAQYYMRSPTFKSWWAQKILYLPLIGGFLSKIYASQILSLLAVQLRNGVPLIAALELITRASGNALIQQRMADIQNEVRRGRNLSRAMGQFPNMPKLALRFLAIGEETGQLDAMAGKAGAQIADQISHRAKTVAAMLGPVIILVMGMMIAFIVISMLVAVYSLTDLAAQ